MRAAALYLRSSKDRSDVSIAAQRRELSTLATDRGLSIVQEYQDVVESAKDEHRPQFQQLFHDMKHGPKWEAILLLDTSRLSRRRHLSLIFEHEAEKRGIAVIYKSVPDTDPITAMLLKSILQGMDEWHSLTSKQKGLAGMAENVRQGYRAGGRAPKGYRLKTIETGAIRDGLAVTKSKLEPDDQSAMVARYLTRRASGMTRKAAAEGLALSASTLISMEWNALTYAGHTVWNVGNERTADGYKGGKKRRPRSEWIIQKHTHPALITEEEAETLLSRLENSTLSQAVSEAKNGNSRYLLTGLLMAPDGTLWSGHAGKYYRLKGDKGRYVPVASVDSAVMSQILADIRAPEFVDALVQAAKKKAPPKDDPSHDLKREMIDINRRLSRTMDLMADLADPGPAIRKVNDLEVRRQQVQHEIDRLADEKAAALSVTRVSRDEVERILSTLADDLNTLPQSQWKQMLSAIIDRVELDPASLECRIAYRVSVSSKLTMASPRGRSGYLTYYRDTIIRKA